MSASASPAPAPYSAPHQTSTPPPPPPKPTSYPGHPGSPLTGPPTPPPPPQEEQQRYSYQHQDPNNYPLQSSSQTPHHPSQHHEPPPNTPLKDPTGHPVPPPSPGWLPPGTTEKSKPDLQRLLSTPTLQTALLQNPATTHPSIPASVALLNQHLAANQQLAHHLTTLHANLLQTRESVQTHLLTVRGLESRWKKKQTELENRLEPWGPRELHQRLVTSIAEQEALCQGVEDSFVEEDEGGGVRGEREVGEWVKRVREGRRVCGLRRERRARWDEGRVGGWR